jgi:hypothetical protein
VGQVRPVFFAPEPPKSRNTDSQPRTSNPSNPWPIVALRGGRIVAYCLDDRFEKLRPFSPQRVLRATVTVLSAINE